MRKLNGQIVFSATDVVNFLECEHLIALDEAQLDHPTPVTEYDEFNQIIQEHGLRHERRYLERLIASGRSIADIGALADTSLTHRIDATREALASGSDVVYQAALQTLPMAGFSDFLEQVPVPSALGGFSYEVVDTKLSRSPKAAYLVQLAFYSRLLADVQGRMPDFMHVVLGDDTRRSYRVADYVRYFGALQRRFLARTPGAQTYPQPCAKCAQCRWSDACTARWVADDHLSLVANIRQSQIKKLVTAGISTLDALASLGDDARIPGLAGETLHTLTHQARLQRQGRQSGIGVVDVLANEPGDGRGFERLPPPDPGDLYFDMEGDPLEPGGLEYLFGVGYRSDGKLEFRPFWAHDRDGERKAFEAFMDFVADHLEQHPLAHVYHYASYERTALQKLMSLHGTREQQVDDFLRFGRLVDLYKVVRESIRTSEPAYSIKNIEHSYRSAREGAVKDAGASIVSYEHWRQTGNQELLDEIQAYNRDDVESTAQLHDWLLSYRPKGSHWRSTSAVQMEERAAARAATSPDAGQEAQELRQQLLEASQATSGAVAEVRLITSQLIDFHRREQKPQWWKFFDCKEMDLPSLIDDPECLGGLEQDPQHPPYPEKRSLVYTYRYPEQDTKLRDGSGCTRLDIGKSVSLLQVNTQTRTVTFKVGISGKVPPPPPRLSLGPDAPLDDKALRGCVVEFAQSVLLADGKFPAVERLLSKEEPVVRGIEVGAPLLPETFSPDDVADLVARLDHSYLVIQGPPGTGKTFTGSHVIASLLAQGFRVGVASNSHKAIHNLLQGVMDVARKQGNAVRGFKKSRADSPETEFNAPEFDNSDKIRDFNPSVHRLFAGTAWAFAGLPAAEPFEFLFIDEAGQVSLANVVAMGTRARNIILLGDQMQLGQPIQGVHPGRSGESVLEYLLDGRATIPPSEGVFLPVTYRMHPAVCRFISDAVYDGRLRCADGVEHRRLVLTGRHHPVLAEVGLRFAAVDHSGNGQSSVEEAEVVAELYRSLLEQQVEFGKDPPRSITSEDILVVSPYNLQVNLLQRMLGAGARVGTVDKFQGQEAAVTIVSMATSSGDELPRDIEFLFSKNRLNVAISRAKCLSIVVASPQLLSVRCQTPEQMALVNTLCWVKDYADESASKAH